MSCKELCNYQTYHYYAPYDEPTHNLFGLVFVEQSNFSCLIKKIQKKINAH